MNFYFDLFDLILINVNTHFVFKKFKHYIFNMYIIVQFYFIKIYYFINQIKQCHKLTKQIYNIFVTKISNINFHIK